MTWVDWAVELDVPSDRVLGATTIHVVRPSDSATSSDVLEQLFGDQAGRWLGGSWQHDGQLFVGADSDQIVCISGADERELDSLLASVVLHLRLAETFRHKLLAQQERYESQYREPFISQVEALEKVLAELSTCSGEECGAETVLAASQKVVTDFSRLSLLHAPTQQIAAMLRANLENLDQDKIEWAIPAAEEPLRAFFVWERDLAIHVDTYVFMQAQEPMSESIAKQETQALPNCRARMCGGAAMSESETEKTLAALRRLRGRTLFRTMLCRMPRNYVDL